LGTKRPARAGMLLVLLLVVVTGLSVTVIWSHAAQSSEDPVVFTVNDEPVTAEEFRFFLQQNKALTVSDFKRKHHADYHADFWTSSYQGQNPLDYAKQKTIEDLKKIKIEQMLMKRHGIIEDLSVASFLKQLETENKDRQQNIRNKQPIYGPQKYGAESFYSYLHSMNYQALIDDLVKKNKAALTDAELKPLYDKIKSDDFHQGYSFDYEIISAESPRPLEQLRDQLLTRPGSVQESIVPLGLSKDIAVRQDTLDMDTKSKDDDGAQELQEMFMAMQPGEFSDILHDHNGPMMLRLLETKDKGCVPYEQVKTSLVQLYMERQLEQLIEDQLRQAKVEIDEEVLKTISFSN